MKSIILISTCFLLWSPVASAAGSDSTNTEKQAAENHFLSKNDDMPLYELSLWGGYAFDSFTLWGKTTDATLGTLGFSINRKFLRFHNTVIEYAAGLSLYARYTYPEFKVGRRRTSLSGFGITPIGLQSNFLTSRNVQPFINTSAGLMFLEKPFPDTRGEKINFTFSVGAGIEFVVAPNASLSIGYKYYHLSNGEIGEVNPGIDSNLFYSSLTFNL